jgi:hypothetical protein
MPVVAKPVSPRFRRHRDLITEQLYRSFGNDNRTKPYKVWAIGILARTCVLRQSPIPGALPTGGAVGCLTDGG